MDEYQYSALHEADVDYEELVSDEKWMMESPNVIVTLAYWLLAACFVAPPTEFISAGLTVQNLLASLLGSEEMNFIYYHVKRTTATVVVHSLIPLGYYICMAFVDWDLNLLYIWKASFYWRLYLAVSLVLPLCAAVLTLYWARNRWRNHPIATNLASHCSGTSSSWNSVASTINIEFRRFDKFTSGIPGRRVIVTDSWIMKTAPYYVYIAQQSDIHLTLVGSDEHDISHQSDVGVQFLNITVASVNEHVGSFSIRLNAAEYSDLRDKLQAPVRNARNIVIQQSLSDRFLEAFRQHVNDNPPYHKPPDMELDQCIGCMQAPSNIKLVKLCDDAEQGDCIQCYCRPMWCLECMGKWFASRQDQGQPETWLGSRSPCPTCRATFCMLDVCKVL